MALHKYSTIWPKIYLIRSLKPGLERIVGGWSWKNLDCNGATGLPCYYSTSTRTRSKNENTSIDSKDFSFHQQVKDKTEQKFSRISGHRYVAFYPVKYCSSVAKQEFLATETYNAVFKRTISHSAYLGSKKGQKSKVKSKKLSLNVDDAEGILDLHNLRERMDDVIEEMKQDFATKVPLRITTGFLDNILIEISKGKKVPLYQVAQIQSISNEFQIEIQDAFPNASKVISSAIIDTGFNMQPTAKGNTIKVPIPVFTHDQRSSIEKIAKSITNNAKDGLRKVRQKGMVQIRNNKEGQSKDLIRKIENQVQHLTDHYTEKTELALEQKLKEANKGK